MGDGRNSQITVHIQWHFHMDVRDSRGLTADKYTGKECDGMH